GVFAPHSNGRTPNIEARIVVNLTGLGIHQLARTLVKELALRNQVGGASNDQNERQQTCQAMHTMEAENHEEQKQRQNSGDPASTREGDGNASEYNNGSIADEDFGNMSKATAES